MPLRTALVLVVTLLSVTSRAAEYGGETTANTDDELAALAAAGELDAEALDVLLSLRDGPIDPRSASVDELAQVPGLGRAEARGVIEGRALQRRERFAAFVEEPTPATARVDVGGVLHQNDEPQGYARLRLAAGSWLRAGALVLARERARFASVGAGLTSDGPRRELGLERWHVALTTGAVRLVTGSFNCDFAEGVTFSSARHLYAPALDIVDTVIRALDARTLRAVPALRGVALQIGVGSIDAVAFASYRSLDLYQYGEWLHDGESPALARADGTPLRTLTLSGAAREALAGGNVEVRFGEHMVGLAGYAGFARLADPAGTFSPASVYPVSGRYGALGGHAVLQHRWARLRGEVATNRTGAVGAVARLDLALGDDGDLALAARSYGRDFDNPYARSVAEPDLTEGARARNERGVELSTAFGVGTWLRLAAALDVWSAFTAPQVVNGRARGRGTLTFGGYESAVLEGERVDKDIRARGVYAGVSCAEGERSCARGSRTTGTMRLITQRPWRSRLALAVRHTREDTNRRPAVETRVMAHLTTRPLTHLAVGVVVSERLTPRTTEIDGARRLLAGTLTGTLSSWARLELMVRSETRWVPAAAAERAVKSGAVTLTVQL